jgi:hypothetical protein
MISGRWRCHSLRGKIQTKNDRYFGMEVSTSTQRIFKISQKIMNLSRANTLAAKKDKHP